jgi:hypothetical protein
MARFPLHTNLDQAQQEFLLELVDAQETLPRDQRQTFVVVQTNGGDVIIHPALRQGPREVMNDLQELAGEGLIRIQYPSRDANVDITNQGYTLARQIRADRGDGVDQVEADVVRYVSGAHFTGRHPQAAAKLQAAQEALANVRVEPSVIGHFCREAFQEFAHAITPDADVGDKPKTKNRIREAIEARRGDLGERRAAWLEALIAYTLTLIDLAQRHEHITAADGEADPEDARIVVFQTAVALYELDRLLAST